MSLKQQALSGVFWSSAQLYGSQLIAFVISWILTRLLLPADFGLIALLAIFTGIASVLLYGGLTNSLIRSEHLDDEDYSTVFYFNLIGSTLFYIGVFFTAPLIAAFYDQEQLTLIVRVYCTTFIINAFAAIQTTRLTKNLDFKTQLKVSVPSIIIGGAVGIAMAYAGFGVWSLVFSSIVQTTASTVQLWYWAKWRPVWVFNMLKFKKHFSFGINLMTSGVIDRLFTNAYTIIIGKFFSPATVGFYNRADTLQMLPVNNISAIITKVTYPLFATIQNDDLRLKNVYKRIMQMVIFLVAPTLMIMAALSEPLFRFMFTATWLPAVPYFQILCFTGMLYPIHSYNLQILNVKGRSDLFLKLEIIKKILIVVVIFASFQFGIYGLLWGSVFISLMAFLINTHFTGKFLNYSAWEQTKDLFPAIGLSLGIGSVVYGFDSIVKNTLSYDFLRLIVSGVLGTALYLSIAFVTKMNSFQELMLIVKRK
jgi:O-antigen/teichoic acid export membrane protein